MSSLRVRAQNKLLNKLGATKASKNIQFDTAFEAFERTADGVAAIEAALKGFSGAMRAFHSSGAMLLMAIDTFATTGDSSAEMKRFASDVKTAFFQVDTHVGNESLARFEKRVLRPAAGWHQRAHVLRHEAAVFQDEKLMFDHYTRKVMSLREARDKRMSSGKPEKPKDVEKLVRNEQKLAQATSSYTKVSEETVKNLREFVAARDQTLKPLVERTLEFRAHYAARVHEESHRMQELVTQEASVLDKILGRLEALLPSSHGHDQQGNATAANVEAVPEPEVHSFTFEGFTGEAPPKSPKESEMVAQDPLDQIAKRDSVRMTAPTMIPSGETDTFVPPPPPPPMFPMQFDSMNDGFSKRSVSEFFPPPPPPPMTTPSAPCSPSSEGMTPWDDLGASVPVAVPVFNQSSDQLSSSWPPVVNNMNTMTGPIATSGFPQSSNDGRRHSSHRSSQAPDGGNIMHQFPTDFHNLHTSAMGPNGGGNAGYPHF